MRGGHLSFETAKAWRERTLEPEQILIASEHLADCRECRKAVAPDLAADRIAATFEDSDEHPEYTDLESIIRGGLPAHDRERWAMHLASCPACATELADLRQFANQRDRAWYRRWMFAIPVLTVAAASLVLIFRTNSGPKSATVSPHIVASIRDSGRAITLDAAGHLRGMEQAPAVVQALAAEALRAEALPKSEATKGLNHLAETPAGSGKPSVALWDFTPAATVSADIQPHFKWKAPERATAFEVTVYTADFQAVVTSPPLMTTEWVCATPLQPGVTYIWTVSTTVNGTRITSPASPEPEARFRVATVVERAELDSAKETGSNFAIAVTAAHLGMQDQARQALDRLGLQTSEDGRLSDTTTNPRIQQINPSPR